MLEPRTSAVALGAVGTAVVAVASIPALLACYRRFGPGKSGYRPVGELYEDKDGKATVESQERFSQVASRVVALLATIVGSLVALAAAIMATIGMSTGQLVEVWLRAASWGVLGFQAVTLFVEPIETKRYTLGLYAALSCLAIAVVTVITNTAFQVDKRVDKEIIGLVATQVGMLFVAMLSFVSIQRRPIVFDNNAGDRPVDCENTTSWLGMITFSWATELLKHAEKHKKVDYEDLPQLEHRLRAGALSGRYEAAKKQSRLWWTIVVEYQWAFFVQTVMIVSSSVVDFLPQVSLLKLLQILETEKASTSMEAWLWVLLLAVATTLITLIDGWLFFTIWSQLGIPLRNMLSTLVFQKSLRRKDVKGAKRKKEKPETAEGGDEPVINDNSGLNGETTAVPQDGGKDKQDDDEEELEQKTRQGTINLIGVDSQRVAIFMTYFYFYPGTLVKLILSIVFLALVIGWQSMIAGFIAFSLTIPLNIWASRHYARLQKDLMAVRDKKLAVVTEALQGIRQIKFSALEQRWQNKINEVRDKELKTIWGTFLYDAGIIMCYVLSPVLLSVACLTTHAIIYGELKPSIAFTTIAILNSMEISLAVLPELTTDAIDAWVSITRIEEYLNAAEKENCCTPKDRIIFKHADTAWPSDDDSPDPDRFVLRDINLEIPQDELTVVSGRTGSGKSLFLASILGEVDKLAGTIYAPVPPSLDQRFDHLATKGNWILPEAIAFVAQIPWIENATIRDNILFGLPYDDGRYQKTLSACALAKDLEMLDDGDKTEIGHNGVNLSGGQRWRVSFARALYSRAGILIMDDIFSAVDAHVGRQLFEEALTGELSVGRTRILVTHHVSLVLPKAKYSIHLANGTISHAGMVKDLEENGTLETIIKETKQDDPDAASSSEPEEETKGLGLTKTASRRSHHSAVVDEGGIDSKAKKQPKKFVEDEKREKGAIKFDVYKEYLASSGGWKIWVPTLLAFVIAAIAEVVRNWWVSQWTASYKEKSVPQSHMKAINPMTMFQTPLQSSNISTSSLSSDPSHSNTVYYLAVYILLNLAMVLFDLLKFFIGIVASIRGSKVLFERLVFTVLRAPLRWLDTVPVGRILNRFTGDFNVIDSYIASHTRFFFYKVMETLCITLISFVISPIMIPLALVLLTIATLISMRYIKVARPVKRLENNGKSPIFELFGSVLMGMGTVRAYCKSPEYITRMWARIDQHGRSFWHLWLLNRWMGFRLAMIGAVFVIVVAIFIVATNVDASLAGFALSFSLNYSDAIIWVLRSYANLELDMTACERVQEYSRLETETQAGAPAPAAWPTEGALEVENLVCGYAPDLPPVLKGLSFSVSKGQRVGVVGRTGAGKSSLTLALFRFLEPREGKVVIDGIDTSTINLASLRSRLAIIPQDPVLFSGTVRSNLDPFGQHSDSELRDALERVHLVSGSTGGTATPATPRADMETPQVESSAGSTTLADANRNIFKSLGSTIAEGGLNLSQGQRQLLCLARAIVARPKLMVLDEATSAVDKETDELIQRSIREEFQGSTLLVIAHRLSTIADFDRILVMGEGRVLEFGSPRVLFEKEDGVFRGMVGESGEKEGLEGVIMGGT